MAPKSTTPDLRFAPPKAFRWFKRVDLKAMTDHVGALRALAAGLADDSLPSAEYTTMALDRFVDSALQGQRGALGRYPPGTWAVTPDDDAPSDARDEYVRQPTLQIVCILAWCRARRAEALGDLRRLDAALRCGMEALAFVGIGGHGVDHPASFAENLDRLGRLGVTALLDSDPAWSPRLAEMIRQARKGGRGK